jgi:5-methylcytosine-specific restriction enzyme subunit McrC
MDKQNSNILIKNIYYMLAYAFTTLKQDTYADVDTEEFENVADLFAEILIIGMSSQVKRGLQKQYLEIEEETTCPHGRIDMSLLMKNQSLKQRTIPIHTDIYSVNTLHNQIIKSTLQLLLADPNVKSKRKPQIKRILDTLYEVESINLQTVSWRTIPFNSNNQTYRLLINICYLTIQGLLQTQADGTTKLMQFLNDDYMHHLFESFVREYYKKEFPQYHPRRSYIDWAVDDKEDLPFLPEMQTDTTLSHNDKILIIDTKYYGRNYQINYDKKSYLSGNMYQIFSYVKNMKATHPEKDISGMLLYAKTNDDSIPHLDTRIDGNKILVEIINLDTEFSIIKESMNKLINFLG